MSKSKWKELPNWQNEDDYAFLDDAPRTVWAWEALRRHQHYRDDWESLQALIAKNDGSQPKYYDPPKPIEWDEQGWLKHTVSEKKELKIITESQKRAEAWGLREMLDPMQPYHKVFGFRLFGEGFPRLLQTSEDYESMIEVIDHGNGFETQQIVRDRAVAGFNMARPLRPQMDMLYEELERQQAQLVLAGVLHVEESPHGFKPSLFKRHIRSLDARRTLPRPTLSQMAKVLDPNNAEKSKTELGKVGARYVKQAKEIMANYKAMITL